MPRNPKNGRENSKRSAPDGETYTGYNGNPANAGRNPNHDRRYAPRDAVSPMRGSRFQDVGGRDDLRDPYANRTTTDRDWGRETNEDKPAVPGAPTWRGQTPAKYDGQDFQDLGGNSAWAGGVEAKPTGTDVDRFGGAQNFPF